MCSTHHVLGSRGGICRSPSSHVSRPASSSPKRFQSHHSPLRLAPPSFLFVDMVSPSLLVLALSASFALAEHISIPLMRMRSPLKHLIANAKKPEYKKLIKELESLHGSKNTVPLFKFLDYEFYGEVLIGHQPFKVIFDTSWADLWVPSILCPVMNIGCAMKNKYDASRSPTYVFTNKTYNRDMGPYNLTGKVSMDTVNLGGLNITNQTFGEVESLPWKDYLFSKADGIFGLSFDTYAANGITPFFYNLIKQKRISKQIFSLYMNRDLITKKGGALLLGDIDPKRYTGNISYVRVNPKSGFWEIPVDGISVKKQGKASASFCIGGCLSIIDSSTNEIRGPAEEIDSINGILKARRFLFGRSLVDCGRVPTLPHVTITIGNVSYVLKGKDIVQMVNYGPATICLSSFSRYDTGGPAKWIFGGAFLARYYSVFDMEYFRVGFARANL